MPKWDQEHDFPTNEDSASILGGTDFHSGNLFVLDISGRKSSGDLAIFCLHNWPPEALRRYMAILDNYCRDFLIGKTQWF